MKPVAGALVNCRCVKCRSVVVSIVADGARYTAHVERIDPVWEVTDDGGGSWKNTVTSGPLPFPIPDPRPKLRANPDDAATLRAKGLVPVECVDCQDRDKVPGGRMILTAGELARGLDHYDRTGKADDIPIKPLPRPPAPE